MTNVPDASDPPHVSLGKLVAYLDEFLESARFQDYGPNGLQVDGQSRITKILTGVSACRELFQKAVDVEADTILVHHGLLWGNIPSPLTGLHYRRISQLIRSGISLIAYHLPLDAHPTVGNNALAARGLGLENTVPFGEAKGNSIGVRGDLPVPVSTSELAESCRGLFEQDPVILGDDSAAAIRSVAIVSGGGQDFLHQAIATDVDAFITGEATEWVTNLAREAGMPYLVAGHYATERLGVRALGDHLAGVFGIDVEFADVPNPI